MRYAFLACFLFSSFFGFRIEAAKADPPALTGDMSRFNFADAAQTMDQVSLTDIDDNSAYFSQFRGKIVLVNVWATWCGPCVMEMPTLDHLQATMGSNDFVVVPVSIDRGGAHQAKPFLDRMGVKNMTPYFDHSNTIGRFLGASRIPVTVIIGRDGNEIGRLVGTADWDGEEAKALLKYFINYGGDVSKAKTAHAESQLASVSSH